MEQMRRTDFVTDNMENRWFLDFSYTKCLLPPTRQYVTQQLYVAIKERNEFGRTQQELLPGVTLRDLFECGDIRKFLTIIQKSADVFTTAQRNLAFRLKQNRDLFDREEVIPDCVKTEVYENVKAFLESFAVVEEDLEALERAWAYGAAGYFKLSKDDREKDKEMADMKQQIQDLLKLVGEQRNKESDDTGSEQNSTGEDYYYSEDEIEEDEQKETQEADTFSLFSNNNGFGFDLPRPNQTYAPPPLTRPVSHQSQLYFHVKNIIDDEVIAEAVVKELSKLPDHLLLMMLDNVQVLEENVFKTFSKLVQKPSSTVQYIDNSHGQNVESSKRHGNNTNRPSKPATEALKPKPAAVRPKPESPKSYSGAAARPASSSPSPVFVKKAKKPEKAPPSSFVVPREANGSKANEVGYKLNYRAPKPDPRFKPEVQLMMGPLPGSLSHEAAYTEMRSIFAARGRVRFQYMTPSFVDRDTNNSVKYGYVAFEEKGDAQRVLKENSVVLMKKYKIKLAKMG